MTHTVLIVDDSPTSVPQLKAMFEGEGYTILTALRGEEALDVLRNAKVDLMVTEALLPGMDGFELVRRVRREPSIRQVPIIMLTVRSGPEDYAASYEAGVDEYFLKPVETMKVAAASRGLIARYEAARTSGNPLGRPGSGGMNGFGRTRRGEIITVFSLKGGVGVSTLAVNLAVGIKQLAPSSRVGLIDLALDKGVDALLLDIVPTSTISDWAQEDMEAANPQLLNEYFVLHRSGISLMAAPAVPEQAEMVRPDSVRKTVQMAPDVFDYVILDAASNFSENTLIALESSHHILLPVTPDMPSLKTAVNTMRILKAVNIPEDKVQVVLNEIVPRAGLTRQHVEGSLNKQAFPIPHAGATFIDAANQGVPAVSSAQPVPAIRAILDLARTVCVPEQDEVVAEEQHGLLGKLRTDVMARLPRVGVS